MSDNVDFEWNRAGIGEILDQIAAGLVETCAQMEPLAKAILAPHRETGAASDSLHVVDKYANGTTPAAFLSTASGDGFFIHEGTVDTEPIPFLTVPLGRVRRNIAKNIQAAGNVTGLKTRTRRTKLGIAGNRSKAFTSLNSIFTDFQTRRQG